MTAPLRPMNLGEILDRTFQIYREKFLLFVGIAAIPSLALRGIHLIDIAWLHTQSLVHPVRQPGIFIWNFAVGLGYYHISSFFSLFIEPAHIKVASGAILGETTSLTSALRFNLARWQSYIWIALLKLSSDLFGPELVMVGLALGIGFVADAAGLMDGSRNWPFVVLLVLPTVTGIYLLLRLRASFSLAMPAAALESLAGFRTMGRGWRLTRGSRARIIFTWLAIFITSWIASSVFELLLWRLIYSFASGLHSAPRAIQLYIPVAYTFLTVFHALIGPIFPIALTLFYYDQRIRLEGYDIERMMDAAGLTVPIMTAPTPILPAPEQPAVEEALVPSAVTPAVSEEVHP